MLALSTSAGLVAEGLAAAPAAEAGPPTDQLRTAVPSRASSRSPRAASGTYVDVDTQFEFKY